MNEPLSTLVAALVLVMIVAGAVMLIASRMPGNERVVRVAFVVVLVVFFGLIGFYFLPR